MVKLRVKTKMWIKYRKLVFLKEKKISSLSENMKTVTNNEYKVTHRTD